jgi:hypothetical protein
MPFLSRFGHDGWQLGGIEGSERRKVYVGLACHGCEGHLVFYEFQKRSDATSVAPAVAVSVSGDVYIGTSPDGHVLKYTPDDENDQQIQIEKPLPTTDLGQPIPGESIFAFEDQQQRKELVGVRRKSGSMMATKGSIAVQVNGDSWHYITYNVLHRRHSHIGSRKAKL